MTVTAALVGGAIGTSCHVVNNALRKIPLSRHPWGHVGGFVIGAWAGVYYQKMEVQMVADVNEMRADRGLPPLISTESYFPKYKNPNADRFTVDPEPENENLTKVNKAAFQKKLAEQTKKLLEMDQHVRGISNEERKAVTLEDIEKSTLPTSIKTVLSKSVLGETLTTEEKIAATNDQMLRSLERMKKENPETALKIEEKLKGEDGKVDFKNLFVNLEKKELTPESFIEKVFERCSKSDETYVQSFKDKLKVRLDKISAMSDDERKERLQFIQAEKKKVLAMSNEQKCRKFVPDWDRLSEAEQVQTRKQMKKLSGLMEYQPPPKGSETKVLLNVKL